MTTTQVVFSIALGTITLIITGFALYVASSTMWGDRWYGRPRRAGEPSDRGTE